MGDWVKKEEDWEHYAKLLAFSSIRNDGVTCGTIIYSDVLMCLWRVAQKYLDADLRRREEEASALAAKCADLEDSGDSREAAAQLGEQLSALSAALVEARAALEAKRAALQVRRRGGRGRGGGGISLVLAR